MRHATVNMVTTTPLRNSHCYLTQAAVSYGPEPQTRKQAIRSSEAQQWKMAMDDEYDSLIENNTWKVVPKPKDRKILSSRWVFKRKLGADGSVKRHKARFVVRGFTQIYGLDFDETYASVVKAPCYRLLFALQARFGWKCRQMDIKTAFLNGGIEHEIYVYPPDGYSEDPDMVLHLQKSLYGLKQASRQWYFRLRAFLETKGWRVNEYDSSIFIHDELRLIMDVYVDDLKIFGVDTIAIERVQEELSTEFHMTDLGECSYYLGMHVHQDENNDVHIHQGSYIRQMLERFNLQDIHPAKTPMRTNADLRKHTGTPLPISFKQTYQSKVGSLNYAAIISRPDISEAVGVVARFGSNPNKEHMEAVDRIMAYVKGCPDMGEIYRHDADKPDMHCYVDSDWAGCKDTRKSTTGYVVLLSGAPIAWKSKRQDTVAQSTCEAEYIAGYKAAQEIVWLQDVIRDLRIPGLSFDKTPLFIDNNGALRLSRNPEFHDRAKHIELKYHYLRKAVQKGQISTLRVDSKDNLADIFTKPLPRDAFQELVGKMGLQTASCTNT